MKRKRILIALGLTALALVLIAAGLLQVYRVYQHYRADMLAYESRHLESIVGTSANGLDWMLRGYDGRFHYALQRPFSMWDAVYLIASAVFFLLMRYGHLQEMIGSIFV